MHSAVVCFRVHQLITSGVSSLEAGERAVLCVKRCLSTYPAGDHSAHTTAVVGLVCSCFGLEAESCTKQDPMDIGVCLFVRAWQKCSTPILIHVPA